MRLPRPWDSPGKNTGVGCHFLLQCMKVKSESEVAQLCPTPSDPMDCSPPGSFIHGIFQARVLESGAIAFYIYLFIIVIMSFQWWCKTKTFCLFCPLPNLECSVVSDSLQPYRLWPTKLLCPLNFPGKNTGMSPSPSPGDLPNPGIKPASPALTGRFFTTEPLGKPLINSLPGIIMNFK